MDEIYAVEDRIHLRTAPDMLTPVKPQASITDRSMASSRNRTPRSVSARQDARSPRSPEHSYNPAEHGPSVTLTYKGDPPGSSRGSPTTKRPRTTAATTGGLAEHDEVR